MFQSHPSIEQAVIMCEQAVFSFEQPGLSFARVNVSFDGPYLCPGVWIVADSDIVRYQGRVVGVVEMVAVQEWTV